MLQKEVKEWLAEYKGLSPTEVHSFACSVVVNEDLLISLYDLFETPPYYVQELDPVCHQLYEFYRSKERKLVLFALQFVPVLAWLYLRCLSFHDNKNCSGAETFLLGVYNLEIVHSDGTQKVESFRIPTVSRSSLYHESRIGGDVLTEQNLRQLNNVHGTWRSGPFLQHERFNAQNRFSILSHVMLVFNNDIDTVHSLSLEALCRVTAKLCSTGFVAVHDVEAQASRIALQPSLMIEFLTGIYFAMFNGHSSEALKAVEAAHERASYELYSDVLLVTNGLLNSHQQCQFSEETGRGIEQMRKKPHMLKNFITNASFKAKKLPDDIEIVEEEGQSIFGGSRLAPVDEEGGISTPAGTDHSVAKGLKARLMTKLGGDRSKYKDLSTGSITTSSKKESMADISYNNAGRRDSELSTGSSCHQQSPRWDNETGSQRDSVVCWVGGRGDSDTSNIDSVGVAVKTLSSGSAGDRGGSKVVVDMLEMEPIKGKQLRNGEEDNGDLYDNYASFQSQAPQQGLWSPPSTPSPSSAPAQSPFTKTGSKMLLSSEPVTASPSQEKIQLSDSGVDPQCLDSASFTTLNGKPLLSNNNSSGINVSYSGSSSFTGGYLKNNSRFSYTMIDGTDKFKPEVGGTVSQSKTSPSLAAEPESLHSFEKSSSSVSSLPSSSSYQSPRDAFFGITETTKSQKLISTSISQSGCKKSSPSHNDSNTLSSSSVLSGEPVVQAKGASKANRNSYSTDL